MRLRVRRTVVGVALLGGALLAAACSSSSSSSAPSAGASSVASSVPGGPSASTTVASGPVLNPALSTVHLALRAVVRGLPGPVGMAIRKGDPALYVAEQYTGRVVAIVDGKLRSAPLLDLHGAVSKGNEQGLLDLAFSPDGAYVYIDYTDPHGDSHVDEYKVRANGTADASTRRAVLFQRQPFPNHNGGEVLFGPDGKLYIGFGDGGSAGDPDGNGQNRDTLLGKILRIDPRPNGSAAYTVPADNPFVGVAHTRPEIWMWGLRNPWRFSFDPVTGALWIGDVGQDRFEEIDIAPKGSKGLNFEWGQREGIYGYKLQDRPAGGIDPVYTYSHSDGSCSVTGGYVYRGKRIASLQGTYVFTDFCKGNVMALTPNGTHTAAATSLHLNVNQPTSLGEDAAGELYVLSRTGVLYQLVPA